MIHDDSPSAPRRSDDRLSAELFSSPDGSGDAATVATSRSALLRRAALVGGSALAAGGVVTALPKLASSAPSTARDTRILNYILRIERLKAAFYRAAIEGGALTGELQQLADVLARHEAQHVAFLRRRLGGQAEAERTYDFGEAVTNPDAFARTTRRLEEMAVAAYIGQGANLTRRLMVPFAQMCSVEARHAAWIADILDADPAPLAADRARTPRQVVAEIQRTGFEAAS